MSLFLFLAALVGGALNAVAGGGSFIALPALLYAGVPPVVANATNTLALWPGSLSSAWAYRREVAATWTWLRTLGGVSLAGGLLGGFLLVRTSDTSFMRLLPWLMFLAAATFTFGGKLTARLRRDTDRARTATDTTAGTTSLAANPSATGRRSLPWWGLLLQLAIAIYGGYFGGGMGIMLLATLSIAGMTDMHEMNGVKSVLAAAINGVALAEFMLFSAIAWVPGAIMVAGAIVGGYGGAAIARRIDQEYVRRFIIVIAWILTVYFFFLR